MSQGSILDRLSDDLRWSAILWFSVIVIAGGWAWLRLGTAQDEASQAAQRHRATARDIQRLTELRRQTVETGDGMRVNVDLVGRVQRALTSAGLPTSACLGVQPRAEQVSISGAGRMQSMELNLSGLTPGEFGSWLAAWNTPEQPWRIREIVLNHQVQGPSSQAAIGLDSNRYQITVLISAPAAEEVP